MGDSRQAGSGASKAAAGGGREGGGGHFAWDGHLGTGSLRVSRYPCTGPSGFSCSAGSLTAGRQGSWGSSAALWLWDPLPLGGHQLGDALPRMPPTPRDEQGAAHGWGMSGCPAQVAPAIPLSVNSSDAAAGPQACPDPPGAVHICLSLAVVMVSGQTT